MRRTLGYIFLGAVAAAGVCALLGRMRGASTLNPLAEGSPDWLGIGLIAAALAAGIGVTLKGGKKGNGNGGETHR